MGSPPSKRGYNLKKRNMLECESTQTQWTAIALHLIDLWGQLYRGNEEMEEKGKGSGGRELIARREGVEYSKGEGLRAGGKGIE